MKCLTTFVSMALLCFGVATASGRNIRTSVTHHKLASQIDFASVFGCANASVQDLGYLIDNVREQADPIGLATLANELAALEKATGKTAEIKSTDLAAEAVGLAKERQHSLELRALAAMLPDQASDLNTVADAAAKIESAPKESGARGVNGTLHVDSHSAEPVDIYVNGTYCGRIGPNGDLYVAVGGPGTTTIFARGVFDGGTWSEQVDEVVGDFTWSLSD